MAKASQAFACPVLATSPKWTSLMPSSTDPLHTSYHYTHDYGSPLSLCLRLSACSAAQGPLLELLPSPLDAAIKSSALQCLQVIGLAAFSLLFCSPARACLAVTTHPHAGVQALSFSGSSWFNAGQHLPFADSKTGGPACRAVPPSQICVWCLARSLNPGTMSLASFSGS
ncbi:hypothetical protein BGZ60DRAFT_208751 [Tricladium varicosporioides]|nr:hypothetical protein BGZ60DRAFT_208751 [Hymenoscyphus varicosporioides]